MSLHPVANSKTVVVTTSWDDGHPCDLKLADMLASRGLPATFYVTSGSLGQAAALSAAELRGLANAGFEIGAHTVTHPLLTELTASQVMSEVVQCKDTLEEILGKEVCSFAYPKGRFNAGVVERVAQAGYRCARGLRMLSLSCDFPAFDMPVTIQAYPHTWTRYARNLLRRGEVFALAKSSMNICSKSWVELGKVLFDRALREGGAWHLLGHSWETEKLHGWNDLEEMLDYVSGRIGVHYLSNGELAEFVGSQNGWLKDRCSQQGLSHCSSQDRSSAQDRR
jgi:peptidoglycan-N-acetylglucosamine deacetylase